MVGVAFRIEFMVGTHDNLGFDTRYRPRYIFSEFEFVIHSAVLVIQKYDVFYAENTRACKLFFLSRGNKTFGADVFVLGAETTVRTDEKIYFLALSRKPCHGASDGDFYIVGMRGDKQISFVFFDFRRRRDGFYKQSVKQHFPTS